MFLEVNGTQIHNQPSSHCLQRSPSRLRLREKPQAGLLPPALCSAAGYTRIRELLRLTFNQ